VLVGRQTAVECPKTSLPLLEAARDEVQKL
jgi:hypothetical protein